MEYETSGPAVEDEAHALYPGICDVDFRYSHPAAAREINGHVLDSRIVQNGVRISPPSPGTLRRAIIRHVNWRTDSHSVPINRCDSRHFRLRTSCSCEIVSSTLAATSRAASRTDVNITHSRPTVRSIIKLVQKECSTYCHPCHTAQRDICRPLCVTGGPRCGIVGAIYAYVGPSGAHLYRLVVEKMARAHRAIND